MTSAESPTAERAALTAAGRCVWLGCDRLAAQQPGAGRPKAYCEQPDEPGGRVHNAQNAYADKQRRVKVGDPTPIPADPVTQGVRTARGALDEARQLTVRLVDQLGVFAEAISAASDVDAVEAQLDAAASAAAQRVAEATGLHAVERQARIGAERERDDAVQAAEDMYGELVEKGEALTTALTEAARAARLAGELHVAQQALEASAAEVERVRQQVGEVEAAREALTGELDAVRTQVRELTVDRDAQRAQAAELSGEVARLGHDVANERGRAERAEAEVTRTEAARVLLAEQLAEAQQEIRTVRADAAEQRGEVVRLGHDLAAARGDVERVQAAAAQTERARAEAAAEAHALAGQLLTAQRERDQADAARTTAEERFSDRTAQVEDLRGELDRVRAELREAREAERAQRTAIQDLTKQLTGKAARETR